MKIELKTREQRLKFASWLLTKSSDYKTIDISAGMKNSIIVFVFNESSEILAHEIFADFKSDEEMNDSYNRLINVLN